MVPLCLLRHLDRKPFVLQHWFLKRSDRPERKSETVPAFRSYSWEHSVPVVTNLVLGITKTRASCLQISELYQALNHLNAWAEAQWSTVLGGWLFLSLAKVTYFHNLSERCLLPHNVLWGGGASALLNPTVDLLFQTQWPLIYFHLDKVQLQPCFNIHLADSPYTELYHIVKVNTSGCPLHKNEMIHFLKMEPIGRK